MKKSRPLDEGPSIAVMPLINLVGDEQQDYFADGLTEELTGELARHLGFKVIASQSTMLGHLHADNFALGFFEIAAPLNRYLKVDDHVIVLLGHIIAAFGRPTYGSPLLTLSTKITTMWYI